MKRIIGVAVIMLTLLLTIVYRQLTAKPAKEKSSRVALTASLREGMALSYLLTN
jgi:hypothetical protein